MLRLHRVFSAGAATAHGSSVVVTRKPASKTLQRVIKEHWACGLLVLVITAERYRTLQPGSIAGDGLNQVLRTAY